MAVPNFKLVQQPDRSFSVSLKTAEGRLKTIDGFDIRAAAYLCPGCHAVGKNLSGNLPL